MTDSTSYFGLRMDYKPLLLKCQPISAICDKNMLFANSERLNRSLFRRKTFFVVIKECLEALDILSLRRDFG